MLELETRSRNRFKETEMSESVTEGSWTLERWAEANWELGLGGGLLRGDSVCIQLVLIGDFFVIQGLIR